MTQAARRFVWPVAVAICLLMALAALSPALAAGDDTRYMSVTLRGKLNDPAASKPMAGAVVR